MATSDAVNQRWSRAFASQALSDLEMRNLLANNDAAKCHRLHFLQMAAEKLCKAFLIRENGYDVLRLTHSVVGKNLAMAIRTTLAGKHPSNSVLKARLKAVKLFGREIELLCPACDASGSREDNCEYPWLMDADDVVTPHLYSFPNIDDESKEFVKLTKLMQVTAEAYLV